MHSIALVKEMKDFTIYIDNVKIQIPIDASLYAHFTEQFKKNTEPQKRRYATLINLVREAYKMGLHDASQ